MNEAEPSLSALVVLRPARGSLQPSDRITSANVAEYLPDPDAVERAIRWFREAGFGVGSPYGLSLSIVGPPSLFRRAFGTSVQLPDPSASQTGRESAEGVTLPLDPLPPEVRDAIETVEFTPPPAFGPTDFMP